MEKKRAAFLTLGCKVNSYETDAMQKLFADAGYQIAGFQEEAEVYVINTCSVTNIADRKSRQMLHRARKLHPQAVIVAAGCYVQTAQKEAAADPAVDIIVGNNRKKEIVSIVEAYLSHKEEQHRETEAYLKDLNTKTEYEPLLITGAAERTRASIKIQDGCNQFCSYCIIPYARGRIRSRALEDIKEEVKGLADAGYQEIVLTGIHLSSYGMDFPESSRPQLLDVIEKLSEIETIQRIRLGSLEPGIMTEKFAGALAENEKFCPHFHLSLQSGCNRTLKRMNRHYTAEEYLEKCQMLRRYFELPAITTDVIVGFPGETEEDFEECRRFLETAAFSQMHIFPYSKRKGTRAETMPDQVPEERKKKRSEILLALEKQMRYNYQKLFLGKKEMLLLEEAVQIGGKTFWTGHTMRYVKVFVPSEGRKDLSNKLAEVRIKETAEFGLGGEFL